MCSFGNGLARQETYMRTCSLLYLVLQHKERCLSVLALLPTYPHKFTNVDGKQVGGLVGK